MLFVYQRPLLVGKVYLCRDEAIGIVASLHLSEASQEPTASEWQLVNGMQQAVFIFKLR